MKYSDVYLKILTHVLGIEGSPTDYSWDPGGNTAFGIAKTYWPQYWANGAPTYAVAQEFYWNEFWKPLRLDSINDPALQAEIFEAAVNCSTDNAVLFAQRAYNLLRVRTWAPLAEDGAIGPKTIRALNMMAGQYRDALLAGCNFYQAQYYVGLNEQLKEKALRGWFAKRLCWVVAQ